MGEPFAALRLPGERIHMVGAGGAGMRGLALILAGLGYRLSGSDLSAGPHLVALAEHGVATWQGHRPEALTDVDLVVASSAVPDDDAELAAARRHGVPVWRRPRLLEALTAAQPALGLAGTHGKTTSTALAVTALHALGEDPTFIVGGDLVGSGSGARLGTDPDFVLEADEAFGTFVRLRFSGLLITNIEPDHLDHYRTVAALEASFATVAAGVAGPVVACADDPGVGRLTAAAQVITYGTSPRAAWRITELTPGRGRVDFRLVGPGGRLQDVGLPLPGAHLARNAAGVLALLAETGRDLAAMAAGLGDFGGVRRRFEVRGSAAGVTVVDDYAHHPTEIGATIAAARLGGWRRVVAVFQPHRYTRTADLADEFGPPLASADHVIVTDVYAAGEPPLPGVTGELVAAAVAAAGGATEYVASPDEAVPRAVAAAGPGDVVLLLGAGDVTILAEPLLAALGGDRRASG